MKCEPLRCVLPAATCATRHAKLIPSGGGKGAPWFPFCHACSIGRSRLRRLELAGWSRPPDTIEAAVLSSSQRAARLRYLRSFPMCPEPCDVVDCA